MRKVIILAMFAIISVGCNKEKTAEPTTVDSGTVQVVPAGVNQNEPVEVQVETKGAPEHTSAGQ